MTSRPPRAFAICDLCFGLATLALAAAIVIATTTGVRKRAQLAAAQNQLRWIAGATSSYAADFEDRMWGLSWQAGTLPHSDPTLPSSAFSNQEAIAIQAIEILHRFGRPDMPVPGAWIASPLYSHLPLLDYVNKPLPALEFVSPLDKWRLEWARDPAGFDLGRFLPFQPSASPSNKRWPYSSSFEAPPAMVSTPYEGPSAMSGAWSIPAALEFRGVQLSSVTFPSQKALLFDRTGVGGGGEWRSVFSPDARILSVAADGSVRRETTGNVNPGWIPTNPTSAFHTWVSYSPSGWEPRRFPAAVSQYPAYYRYTRGGPTGRDFGGPEVDTGQP